MLTSHAEGLAADNPFGYDKDSDEVICSLGLQKSNYSNCYYVNVGIVIKEINPNLELPRDVDGDIRCRFYFEVDGNQIDCLPIDKLSERNVIASLEKNILELVDPSLEPEGIKKLLNDKPVLLYQTKMVVKKHLGIEG
ncbi:DUF4304 domain-containing protein [Ectobacillus sp. JY-23]|nr:DUF4304 domain-containing protein [Ectobacillus sp. JY-23]UOY92401.1 DUF4304 domain-containing protein [Ectobacillus sp. JY-23]